MTTVTLEQAVTRSQLREFHEALSALPEEAPVSLHINGELHPLTPGQFSAWLQLVLTWGQNFHNSHLHLTQDALVRADGPASLSDIEVFAVVLASTVMGPDGADVTDDVKSKARDALADRGVLTEHTGDGEGASRSLLLASHTFSNKTSTELHAKWDSKLAIEETARTLYHDIWPSTKPPHALRRPLVEFGEIASPESAPTHITRDHLPEGHPRPPADGVFVNLGRRMPQPRGMAYELATAVRHQPKPLHDEVGEILFELIQNTEWHATKWPGGRTGANCRVIHFREFGYTREQLREADDFDPHFVAYVRKVANFALERQKHISEVRFGAATIVDSGAGLARSVALSLDEEALLDEHTEIGYLIRALNKSLKVRRADMGNIGLTRVQQSLTNLRGFMSVRTGTVEILRDFVTRPFEQLPEIVGPIPPALFLDWVPDANEDFYVGPRIGTAVTIVYPVDLEGRG